MLNKTGYFFTNSVMSPTQKNPKNDKLSLKTSNTNTAQSLDMKKNDQFQFKSSQIQQSIRENNERQELLSKYSSKFNHNSQSKFQQQSISNQYQLQENTNEYKQINKEKSRSNIKNVDVSSNNINNINNLAIKSRNKQKVESNLQSSITDGQQLQQSQTDQSTLNNTFVNNFTFTFKINDTFGNKSQQQQQMQQSQQNQPQQQSQQSPKKKHQKPQDPQLYQQSSQQKQQKQEQDLYYQISQNQFSQSQHKKQHNSQQKLFQVKEQVKDQVKEQVKQQELQTQSVTDNSIKEQKQQDYIPNYKQNNFIQEQQFQKQSQVVEEYNSKFNKIKSHLNTENINRNELCSTIKNPSELINNSVQKSIDSNSKIKKYNNSNILHESSELIIKNSKKSNGINTNMIPQNNNQDFQVYQQRLKEKEQVIQQLQNYYSKLSENYEQSKKNMQQKISELTEQVKSKDAQITSLQESKQKMQSQLDSNSNVQSKFINSQQKTRTLTSQNNFNNSFKSADSSEIELSEKYNNYNQFRSSQSNNNEDNINPMNTQKAIISLQKHQSKISEINLNNNKQQNVHMKRNQSATQMMNVDNQVIQQQLSTQQSIQQTQLEKQQSKQMRSFNKFYESLIKMIKDCNHPNKVIENIIQTGDQKKGLKFIWKWIKTLMDDYMKMKTKIKIQQTKEINNNSEILELFLQFNKSNVTNLDQFMNNQKENSKLKNIYELYQKQQLKNN